MCGFRVQGLGCRAEGSGGFYLKFKVPSEIVHLNPSSYYDLNPKPLKPQNSKTLKP